MRILLVQPAPFENGRIGLENALWFTEPVALTSIAAEVEEGNEIKIFDMRLEEADQLPKLIADFKPRVVGVTCMTTDAYQAQAVLHCAKSILGEQVFTIIGGHHPTLDPSSHNFPYIDAVAVGEGEETFKELISHLDNGGAHNELSHIDGLVYFQNNEKIKTAKRSQEKSMDVFKKPARHLIDHYKNKYFFASASPMAAIQTSRGCEFTCNFCAIWQFYEKKIRFLSAEKIADRMEECDEQFIFFLDDNFLTNKKRLVKLCEEIERRKIKKYWMIQGRTDFIVANEELVKRLRDCGLIMVLSGYEGNDQSTLDSLKKDNSWENNQKAAAILRKYSIFSTGIFMVRPDFTEEQFEELYAAINEMKIPIPIVVIHMPLPGTNLWREMKHQLLTKDLRLFDLLHAVTPTKLPRKKFYQHYARWNTATMASITPYRILSMLIKRPRLLFALMKAYPTFKKRREILRKTINDPSSYLRDEEGILHDKPLDSIAV
jgi:radical SAM superfamily enzyme YgiQ (UPF0313 family)